MAFEFYRLKNGVRVMLVPMEGVESLGVGVYVQTGSRYETRQNNGISHFLEHMVFKGTAKYPTHEETSRLEGLGAIQNAWTDVDATAYWCKIPVDYWKDGLEVVKELALNPLIPEKDLEIERGVILEEIHRRDDRPDEMAEEELMKLMFANNGLGMTTLGEEEVIKNIKREDFIKYHQSQYQAGGMVVAIAGKITNYKLQITNMIEKWFAPLPFGKGLDFEKAEDRQTEPRISIKNKELAAQAHIELAVRGITVRDPRKYALDILTSYLGQGLSSRLFLELREKRGLCYAISGGGMKLADTGTWGVYAGLAIEKLEEAVKAIWTEMKRMREYKLTDSELLQAKEKIRGPMLFAMENPVRQMEYYARQVLDHPEEVLDYKEEINRVMQITSEEIRKVAESLFVIQKVNLAVVGPVRQEMKEKLVKLINV